MLGIKTNQSTKGQMYKGGGWGCCSFMLIDKLGFQFISSTFTFNQYCKEKKRTITMTIKMTMMIKMIMMTMIKIMTAL